MKEFDCDALEFWLPQLVALCLATLSDDDGESIVASFIIDRCQHFVSFSLRMTWWLRALIQQAEEPEARLAIARGILGRIHAAAPNFPVPEMRIPVPSPTKSKGQHRRSKSTGPHLSLFGPEQLESPARLGAPTASALQIGRIPNGAGHASPAIMDTGRAFDWPTLPRSHSNVDLGSMEIGAGADGSGAVDERALPTGAITLQQCMKAQLSFVMALMQIGNKLRRFGDKDVRRSQLLAELALMNLNLPARVYLPLSMSTSDQDDGADETSGTHPPNVAGAEHIGFLQDHHVVRLPPQEAAILNSRDRVPYLLYVEVLTCDHCQTSAMPPKMSLNTSAGKLDQVTSGGNIINLPVAAAETSKATKAGVVAVSDIRARLRKASEASTIVDANDPSAKAFREPWMDKLERIRLSSPYGHLPNWKVVPIIVKNGDDLRQEVLASQLMTAFQNAWQTEGLKLWIKPLGVVVTDGDGGMIEVVGSGVSLHQIKRNYSSLLMFLQSENGGNETPAFAKAQQSFTESLAGYSLFCYFVQVKDRHNSNILLDGDGHIIHIDFGFMLSTGNSPGRGLNFEKAPFKLTVEFLEVMGGPDGDMFKYFRSLLLQGFLAARKHMGEILPLLAIILPESKLPCLVGGQEAVKAFEDRFALTMTEEAIVVHVNGLIDSSLSSIRTQLYDQFQFLSNGIR
jgi:phosphatidylinositol 4-kinase